MGTQLSLQLGLLGDPTALLTSFYTGHPQSQTPWLAIAIGAIPLAAASLRWLRGRAGDGERMLLAATAGSVLAGALFYPRQGEVQLAFPLEPLWAIAVVEQARACAPRWEALALTTVLLIRVYSGVTAFNLKCGNPMMSGQTQRACVETLRARGIRGPELLTTTYNHAGVIEAWTRGGIEPVHAWPLFSHAPDQAWRALFDWRTPQWVLLTDGVNPSEGADVEPRAIATALEKVAAERGFTIAERLEFPTESGAPGWALVRLAHR